VFEDHKYIKTTVSSYDGRDDIYMSVNILSEFRFYVPLHTKQIFWRRSSQPISWINTENKDQSLTSQRDALHHATVLQTNNVDAQCDKLATELS